MAAPVGGDEYGAIDAGGRLERPVRQAGGGDGVALGQEAGGLLIGLGVDDEHGAVGLLRAGDGDAPEDARIPGRHVREDAVHRHGELVLVEEVARHGRDAVVDA